MPLQNKAPLAKGRSLEFLSGAAVCDGVYYGAWSDIEWGLTGIVSVDLQTGNTASQHAGPPTTGGDPNKLIHAVFCDEAARAADASGPAQLLTVVSEPATGADKAAPFSVQRTTMASGGTTLNMTTLAEFHNSGWEGSDSSFAYHKGKIWATFPATLDSKDKQQKGGVLMQVDGATGKVNKFAIPQSSGYPRRIIPDDGTGATVGGFYSASMPGECCSRGELKWADITLGSDGTMSTKDRFGFSAKAFDTM